MNGRLFHRLFHSTSVQFSRKDYYSILQLTHQADKKTIKSHYYRLSKKYHPDLNPNNETAHEMFLEINEAYAILGNEANKRSYDNETPSYSTQPTNSGVYAWQFKRRTSRNTGSASAREQAENLRKGRAHFDQKEHFTRHYEAEEQRRRSRVAQAAQRRKEAGGVDETRIYGKRENIWSRIWKLSIVLAGIGYSTKFIVS